MSTSVPLPDFGFTGIKSSKCLPLCHYLTSVSLASRAPNVHFCAITWLWLHWHQELQMSTSVPLPDFGFTGIKNSKCLPLCHYLTSVSLVSRAPNVHLCAITWLWLHWHQELQTSTSVPLPDFGFTGIKSSKCLPLCHYLTSVSLYQELQMSTSVPLPDFSFLSIKSSKRPPWLRFH